MANGFRTADGRFFLNGVWEFNVVDVMWDGSPLASLVSGVHHLDAKLGDVQVGTPEW